MNLRYYRSMYLRFTSQYIKGLMEYRMDFLIGISAFILYQSSSVVFLGVMFTHIPDLEGWGFYEILLIYGFSNIPRGIDHLLTDNLWLFAQNIVVKGDFDRYLIRPVPPLFHLLAERFQPEALGELIVGIGLFSISYLKLGLSFSLLGWIWFALGVIAGSFIYFAIKLIFASLAFWYKNSHAIMWLNYNQAEFAKYPMPIYSKPIQALITYLVPFAFTAFYPGAVLLGRVPPLVGIAGSILVAVISVSLGFTIWNRGMRHYESAGS